MLIVFNHYLVSIRNHLSFVINYDIRYSIIQEIGWRGYDPPERIHIE